MESTQLPNKLNLVHSNEKETIEERSGEYTTPQQIKSSSYTPSTNDRGKIVESTQLPNKLNLVATLQVQMIEER